VPVDHWTWADIAASDIKDRYYGYAVLSFYKNICGNQTESIVEGLLELACTESKALEEELKIVIYLQTGYDNQKVYGICTAECITQVNGTGTGGKTAYFYCTGECITLVNGTGTGGNTAYFY
jgi:hypothetical protein